MSARDSRRPQPRSASERAYSLTDPRSAIGRLVLSLVAGFATGLLLPARLGWPLQVTLAWDVGALFLLCMVWLFVMTSDASSTRCRAAQADPGRTAVWILVTMASAFSLFAAVGLMRHAKGLVPEPDRVLVPTALLAVMAAWALTHTAFTLRYAHLYYRDDDEGEGGLVFPGTKKPDDFDFAYFAFTIGMCFQVSDVGVTSPVIRRAVLAHALMSFAYNTVILSLSLNLLFGLMN
jgi:uncharacterized membrane protein